MVKQNIKVKLGAIARDEAAYLPEWIFHHLHLGFDEVEVYLNNTNDNSLSVLNNIAKNYPVLITQADALFKASQKNFQALAYQEMVLRAMHQGFTYILFLDIDEFWTPADFKSTVKQLLAGFNYPQALCLNWLIHHDESEFSRCYKQSLKVRPDRHVKTLFKLDGKWEKIDIHNILGADIEYMRGNGSRYDFGDSPHCGLTDSNCLDHKCYILHRMFRSQMEYISLLARGRANKTEIKDNRNGYYNTVQTHELCFEQRLVSQYYQSYELFLKECSLALLMQDAQDFVKQRFMRVLSLAQRSSPEEAKLFDKLFKGVDLPEVVVLKEKIKKKARRANFDLSKVETLSWRALFQQIFFKIFRRIKLNRLAEKLYFNGVGNTLLHQNMFVNGVREALVRVQYPQNKRADIYRELAIYFYRHHQIDLACLCIEIAKKQRPEGPYIIELHKKYMAEKNIK